jgi:hypothetical protein
MRTVRATRATEFENARTKAMPTKIFERHNGCRFEMVDASSRTWSLQKRLRDDQLHSP